MKKKIFGTSVALIVIIALFVASQSFYTVEPNQYANTVRFSKTVNTVSEAGLYLKVPFIDNVIYFPKQVLLYDMKPSDVLTADSKTMQVDNYVTWRITDPLTFYKTLGNIDEAETRINMLTYSAIKTEMGKLERDKIINSDSSSRDDFNNNIINATADATTFYGIEIMDIKIKKLDLPEDNEQAVYTRMISERNKIAAEYRADGEKQATLIKNEVDKITGITVSNALAEAETIKAEGETEYMNILAAAYNTPAKQEFYEFTRALDALEASLAGGNSTIILDKDSPIARALMNQ
ncbi:MAG: protease modulator HflC [Clostridia bacterium]|nr:protease modulator HflC [Clostridia bacterium]